MSADVSRRSLRLTAIAAAVGVPVAAWVLGDFVGYRGQAAAGAICFIAIVAACSPNLRLVRWRTVLWGMALQLLLALLILKVEIGGVRPGYALFSAIAGGVTRFLQFSDAGAVLFFGALADQQKVTEVFVAG